MPSEQLHSSHEQQEPSQTVISDGEAAVRSIAAIAGRIQPESRIASGIWQNFCTQAISVIPSFSEESAAFFSDVVGLVRDATRIDPKRSQTVDIAEGILYILKNPDKISEGKRRVRSLINEALER